MVTELLLRISDNGSLEVLDRASGKFRMLHDEAQRAGEAANRGVVLFDNFGRAVQRTTTTHDANTEASKRGAVANDTLAGSLARYAANSTAATTVGGPLAGIITRHATAAGGAAIAFGALGVAVAGSAIAVTAAVRANVDRADQLLSLARTTGLAVEELSELELVARKNNESLGTVAGGIKELNKSMVDAANGAGRDAALFRALDVDIKNADGTIRDALDVLDDLADKLRQVPDGAEKSAAASRLFGGDAEAMLKVIKGGSGEIATLRGEADKLGYKLDTETAEAANRVKDNLDSMSTSVQGLVLQLGRPFIDAADVATGKLAALAEQTAKEPGALMTKISGSLVLVKNQASSALAVLQAIANLPNTAYRGRGFIPPDFDDVEGGTSSTGPGGEPFPPNAGPTITDKLLQQRLAAALGRPDEGAGDAARKAQELAEKSAVAAQQAAQQRAETTLAAAEAELAVFERRFQGELALAQTQGERLTVLAQFESEAVDRARAIDQAQQAVLGGQIAVLQEKRKGVEVTAGEKELIDAQIGQLALQKQLIAGSAGEAAQVANEFTRARVEIENANRVTINLGSTLNSSLKRAVDGLFNRGTGGLTEVVADTGKAIASDIAGGFLEAQLKKKEFDQKFGENFTVTLPGFVKTGTDSIKSVWGSTMEFLGFGAEQTATDISHSFDSAAQNVNSSVTTLSNSLNGLARNTAGLGAGTDGAVNFSAGDGGQSTIAGGTSAFGGPGGTGLSATSGGASNAAAAGAAGGAAAAGYLAIALAAIGGIQGALDSAKAERHRLGSTDSSTGAAALGGWFEGAFGAVGLDGVGQLIGSGTRDLPIEAVQANAWTLGPVEGLLVTLLSHAKSRGTQVKKGLNDLLSDAGVPRQREVYVGGRTGVQTQFIEGATNAGDIALFNALGFTGFNTPGINQSIESVAGRYPDLGNGNVRFRNEEAARLQLELEAAARANPELNTLRFKGALGAGAVLGNTGADAFGISNAFTNNLLLLGVQEEEARRLLQKTVRGAGFDLEGGLEEINRKYLRGEFKDDPLTDVNEKIQQTTAAVAGFTDIFQEDMPAGIDLAALALENFAEKGGLNIANFNKELERQLEIYGRLEAAAEAGLRAGLDFATSGLAQRDALIEAGAPVNEIVRAVGRSRAALTSALYDAIREGMTTAINDGLQDAIQDSPQWKALTEQIAKAVQGVPLGDIPKLVGDLIGASLPQIEAAAAAQAAVNRQIGVTPTALFQSADAIRAEIEQRRFDTLSPRNQEASLRRDLREIDAELAQLRVGGIVGAEVARARELAEERARVAFQLGDLGAARYADGSAAEQRALEESNRIAEETADLFEELGTAQQALIDGQQQNTDMLGRNVDTTDRLTRTNERVIFALNRLTGAIEKQGGGGGNSRVQDDRNIHRLIEGYFIEDKASNASRQRIASYGRTRG